MSYTIEKVIGEPVILCRIDADYDPHEEAVRVIEEMTSLVAQQTESVFMIFDLRQPSFDLQNILEEANRMRSVVDSRSNLRGIMVITSDEGIKLAMQGLNSEVFGYIHIPVFEDIDEALDYIHEQSGQS